MCERGSHRLPGEVRHLLAAQRLQRGVRRIPRLVLYEAKAAQPQVLSLPSVCCKQRLHLDDAHATRRYAPARCCPWNSEPSSS